MSVENETIPPPVSTEKPVGSSSVSIILIVIQVLLSLFWLGIALLQVIVALTQPNMSYLLVVAFFNALISIFNLFLIREILHRYKRVVKTMLIYGITGSVWGALQLLSGVWIQGCVIPFYIVLAVLPQTNKEYFSVLTKKEQVKATQESASQVSADGETNSYLPAPPSTSKLERLIRKITVGDVEKVD